MKTYRPVTLAIIAFALVFSTGQFAAAEVSKEELQSISTPDKVKTSLGELKFFDGVPTDATVKMLYDNLDRMRGVQVFLNTLPGASVYRLRAGNAKIGADKSNRVAISSQLLDSKSLYLTANTSTLYAQEFLDTEIDGPTVIEIPPGQLGLVNDSWFRYVGDLGVIGPDKGKGKGKGGKYLVLPPGYKGAVPEGYFVMRPQTYNMWFFFLGFLEDGSPAPAVASIKKNLRVYPLAKAENPPQMNFVKVSDKYFNTIGPIDFSFFDDINKVVQEEPTASMDPDNLGMLASVSIVKGKPFKPDARMKKILTEAAAVADITARAIAYKSRVPEAYFYENSAWAHLTQEAIVHAKPIEDARQSDKHTADLDLR